MRVEHGERFWENNQSIKRNCRHDHVYTDYRYTCYIWCSTRCCDWVVDMDGMVKRKQQKLKYYRYCLRKARELFRVSVVDYEVRMEMRKKYGK